MLQCSEACTHQRLQLFGFHSSGHRQPGSRDRKLAIVLTLRHPPTTATTTIITSTTNHHSRRVFPVSRSRLREATTGRPVPGRGPPLVTQLVFCLWDGRGGTVKGPEMDQLERTLAPVNLSGAEVDIPVSKGPFYRSPIATAFLPSQENMLLVQYKFCMGKRAENPVSSLEFFQTLCVV